MSKKQNSPSKKLEIEKLIDELRASIVDLEEKIRKFPQTHQLEKHLPTKYSSEPYIISKEYSSEPYVMGKIGAPHIKKEYSTTFYVTRCKSNKPYVTQFKSNDLYVFSI